MTALVVLKATFILGFSVLVAYAAKRWVAATRHALLVAAQAAVLLVPLLGGAVPVVIVDLPADDGPFDVTIPTIARTATTSAFPGLWLTGVAVVAAAKLLAYARAMGVVRRSTGTSQRRGRATLFLRTPHHSACERS